MIPWPGYKASIRSKRWKRYSGNWRWTKRASSTLFIFNRPCLVNHANSLFYHIFWTDITEICWCSSVGCISSILSLPAVPLPPAISMIWLIGLHSYSKRSFPFGLLLSSGYIKIPPLISVRCRSGHHAADIAVRIGAACGFIIFHTEIEIAFQFVIQFAGIALIDGIDLSIEGNAYPCGKSTKFAMLCSSVNPLTPNRVA